MNKLKKGIKRNSVFVILMLITCFLAILYELSGCIGENPFAAQYRLKNPSQVLFAKDYHYYLINSSYEILATDEENRFLFSMKGGDEKNSFYYAEAMAAGEKGELYVLDKTYSDSGAFINRNRILKFSSQGKECEVLYELETADEDGNQKKRLDCLRIIDGNLYFSEIDETGIYIKGVKGEGVSKYGFMPWENAERLVADSTFNNQFEIAIALKNGDVYKEEAGEAVCAYDASTHVTEEFLSEIGEVSYDDEGILYLNDIGQRKIYALDQGEIRTVVERSKGGASSRELALCPMYSGMNVADGNLSLICTEYKKDSGSGEEYYDYKAYVRSTAGNAVYYGDTTGVAVTRRVQEILVYVILLLLFLIFVFSAIKLVRLIKKRGGIQGKTQLLVLVMAVAVTIVVSMTIFNSYNQKFASESAANLSNIAYLIEERLDKDCVSKIDSPDAYYGEAYQEINVKIMGVLKNEANRESNVYAVLYKIKDNIIYEVYRDSQDRGCAYPLAGEFKDSIEETVYETGERYLSQEFQLAEGNFTFVLVPVRDQDNNSIALLEVGTDYNYFAQASRDLYKKMLITVGIGVIVAMLLFSELLNGWIAFQEKRKAALMKAAYPPEVIRPVVFMVIFTANITTTFLPLYGMSLWDESFPLPAEVAAAFPLSAELVMGAVCTLICGFLARKAKIRRLCIGGAMFYIGGNLLSIFATNLWMLIAANSACGIGGGMLTIGIDSWITKLDGEEKQNKGFVYENAATLAGMNCGTVIGSMIWESFGTKAAYVTAAISGGILCMLCVFLLDKRKAAGQQKREGKALRYFITPGIIRYLICLATPYLICASFLSYYFPIVAEYNQLSAAEISMAFLISGVISIHAGSALGETVTETLGVYRAMILASFIYCIALFYMVLNPSVTSCYVVIVLFAIADSFGLAAQSVYFVSLPEVKAIGESQALAIKSTLDSFVSAVGTIIFGGALLLGERKGILLIASVFTLLLILFKAGEKRKDENADTSECQ